MNLNIKLGNYTLLQELGRGGYGTVYLARDEALQIERAVKVLHPSLVADPQFIERFREEARLVAQLKHEHIVKVFYMDEEQGHIYLAMEFLAGGSLKDVLGRDGALPYARAVAIFRQITRALDYAHGKNLVHRDVKPGNILLDADGKAYLSDFGFAKSLASADSSTSMSVSGGALGTPAYMAPEAWDGKGWTPAADVYSLACVLVEMLTGRLLFDGGSLSEIVKQHVVEGPRFPDPWPAPEMAAKEVVLRQALAMKSDERFSSAGVFADALASESRKSEVPDQPPPPPPEPEETIFDNIADWWKETIPFLVQRARDASAKLGNALQKTRPFWLQIFRKKSIWIGLAAVLLMAAVIGLGSHLPMPPSAPEINSSLYFVSNRSGKDEIYRLRDTGAERLTSTPGGGESWDPFVNLSGTMYFVSDRSGKAEIYRLRETQVEQLTSTPGNGESWSPFVSATGALYYVSDRSGKAEIYRLRDSEAEQLTSTPSNGESWSPFISTTGALYFVSDRSGKAEIYRLRGTDIEQITSTPGSAESWSPIVSSTGALYFVSDRSGKAEIYRLREKEVEQLTFTPGLGESKSPNIGLSGVLYFVSDRGGKDEIYRLDDNKTEQITITLKSWESTSPFVYP